MSTKSEIESLVKEIKDYGNTERGINAKIKYDILKFEEERKRNNFSFINTILLSFIALVNLVLAYLKYKQGN